jgi:hypothetical protein
MASTMVFRGQCDARERERVPIALNRNVTPARRKTVFVENALVRAALAPLLNTAACRWDRP